MTTLHDRLADLAEDAPLGGPAPELWDRGRRYARLRRGGSAVIIASIVILLGIVAGLDWHRSAPAPVPAHGPVGLPDQMWSPSPWLASTDRPGQLVAVSGAERGTWTGMESALVGISATSGAYAFVDLPDVDLENGEVELAPDGRHVAYWLTGPTTDTPNSDSGPITGVAIYDLETGEVARHWISTAHGLMPDFLAWADADTLTFSAGQILGGDDDPDMDQSSSKFGTVTSWTLGGEPSPLPGVSPGASLEGAGHGWIVVDANSARSGQRHIIVDVADPQRARFIDYPSVAGAVGSLHFVAPDESGRRLGLIAGTSNPGTVSVGIGASFDQVPGTRRTSGVVDWIDGDTIVTLGATDPHWFGNALFRVDVQSGKASRLVRFTTDTSGGAWQFATDLLVAPSIEGIEPPSPLDPRKVTGVLVLVVLGGLGALVLWRRRVRP